MSSLTQLIAPMTCVKGGVKAILFGLAFDNNRKYMKNRDIFDSVWTRAKVWIKALVT